MMSTSIRMNPQINKTDLLIFASAFSLFKIDALSYISHGFTFLYLLLQLFCAVYFSLRVISLKKIHTIDLATIFFCIVGFVSTVLNGLSLETWIREMLRMVSMLYSARWGLEKCSEKFIRINAVYGGLLCIINTISAILVFSKALIYDNGVSPIFILGGDNTSIRLYILAVTFCVLESTRKTDCFTFIVWMSFTVFTFLRDIGTGKICLFIITLGIILFVIQDISLPRHVMRYTGIVNIILFFLLIVIGNIQVFSYIIVKLLHRDLTLTARTVIWNITLEKISQKPILGNGYVTGKQFESMLPSIIGVNAHNTYLMVIYMGGFIMFFFFVLVYISAQKMCDNYLNLRKYSILLVALIAMMIRAQVEGGDATFLFFLFHMIYSLSVKELWRNISTC